jgi:UDP-N-acetylmuramate dehydrogenase
MKVSENVSLADFSTMGLGGRASYLTEITSRMEVITALDWARARRLPSVMIGGGSNIVWSDAGFQGLVMVNKITSYEVFQEDDTNFYLTIGAGEPWDGVVERSVSAGLTGIEALSLIPGTAGATPIQNVGAYGQEISQSLTTVEAFDTQAKDFVTLAGADCGFSYRSSRFKTTDRGRFYITGLTLHLMKGNPLPPFYGAVQAYFEEHGVTDYTPAALREAVVAIRSAKLPDPAVVRNTGSFFANPLVSEPKYAELAQSYEPLPHWAAGENKVKLSAAWLIAEAGFKDYHDAETGMATWPKQSLVLINEKARRTADLLAFKKKIVDAVQAKFGITLEQEPEMLPG